MSETEKSIDYKSYLGKALSELIILSALNPDKRYSAYQLIKIIKEESIEKISFLAGTIYPQMQNLEKKGFLQKHIVPTPSRSEGVIRQKSEYSLTLKGKEVLKKRKEEWIELQKIINHLIDF
ncbi:MAG: PadR family transcriptional regulator [Promethearchaeota archaeon]